MTTTPPILVDSRAASLATHVPAATIRTWAARGHLARRGTDARGRTLYDLDEVHECAARRGYLDPDTQGDLRSLHRDAR